MPKTEQHQLDDGLERTDQTKKLIQLVRDHPVIWDKKDPQYRGKFAKERAWREIFNVLEPDYENMSNTDRLEYGMVMVKKWYNVRDSYVKSIKSSYRKSRPYIYSEDISFLDSVYLNRTAKRKKSETKSLDDSTISDDDHEIDGEGDDNWNNQVFVDVSEHSNASEPLPKKNKLENTNTEDIVSVLANLIEKEEDDDRSFFKSIIPSVKALSNEAKLEFRIEVMKLLKKLKHEDTIGQGFMKAERHNNDDESF